MSTHSPPSPFRSPRRAWLWRILLASVLVSTLTASGLAGASFVLDRKLQQAQDVALELDEALPGSMNFLVLGSDSRAFVDDETDRKSFGSTRDVGGQRADAIIIARVEPRSRHGVLVSIPRDLLVNVPGHKGRRRINESFERGPQGVIDTIKANFNVPIHHYLELDFAGFRSMVDALGGVRMYTASPVRDRQTGLDLRVPGCVVLDGRQALAWVRSRHFSYLEAGKWHTDPTGDLGRINRQQDFIRRLMVQAVEKGALNPLRANRLADATMANLKVDSDFDVRDALRLVQAFRPVGPAGVEMVALPTRPVGAHLAASPESETVLARLRADSGSPGGGEATGAPAPKVSPSEVRVRVLNGTGAAGLAGDTSAALGAAGFAPAGAGDAGRFSYSRTEIRYPPAARAKAELVARYLKGAGRLVADPTVRNLDVVLILGPDFKGVTSPGPLPDSASAPSTTTTGRASTSKPAGGSATTPAAPPSATAAPSDARAPNGASAQPAC